MLQVQTLLVLFFLLSANLYDLLNIMIGCQICGSYIDLYIVPQKLSS